MKISLTFNVLVAAIMGATMVQGGGLRARTKEGGGLRARTKEGGEQKVMAKSNARVLIPFQTGHMIGDGVNVMTGRSRFATFDFVDTDRTDQFRQLFHYLSTTTSSEMRDAANTLISAEAAGFGATMSGSMNWITSRGISSEAINLIMGTTITSHTEIINTRTIESVDESLLNNLRTMKQEGRLQDFVAMYGTHYISGMQYGGSAYSRISITTQSREDREQIASNVTAAFKAASFSGSAAFKQEIENVQKTMQVTVTADSFIEGTPSPGLQSTDLDKVRAAIEQFGTEINNRERTPMPLFAICSEWETIREVREILGEESLLPFVPSSTINAISTSFASLQFSAGLATSLRSPRHPQWLDRPRWILESRDVQVTEIHNQVVADTSRIAALSYADLAYLDPSSLSFARDFLQFPIYEDGLNTIADGNMHIQWRFVPTTEVNYNGPLQGRTLIPYEILQNVDGTPVVLFRGTSVANNQNTPFAIVGQFRSVESGGPQLRIGISFNNQMPRNTWGEFLDSRGQESRMAWGESRDYASNAFASYI